MKNRITYKTTLVITFFMILCAVTIFRLDSSTTAVDPYIIPEVSNTGFIHHHPLVLLSYADGHPTFFKNQFALTQSAADKGFDTIYLFKRRHIKPDFWNKNQIILKEKHGAGYWLWKPYFILEVMKQLPYGATIIYADGAVIFKKPLGPLLKQLENYDMIIPINGTPVPLSYQLKKEAYDAFDQELTPEILQQDSTWAFFMAIKNTATTQAFVEKWLNLCEKPDAIMNTPLNPDIQSPEFQMHLNDQAILSVLVAQDPAKKLLIRRNILRSTYGVHNFHRHTDGEFKSPLLLIANSPKLISEYIWNNPLLVKLREVFSSPKE